MQSLVYAVLRHAMLRKPKGKAIKRRTTVKNGGRSAVANRKGKKPNRIIGNVLRAAGFVSAVAIATWAHIQHAVDLFVGGLWTIALAFLIASIITALHDGSWFFRSLAFLLSFFSAQSGRLSILFRRRFG
jgi:hypothetical protein